MNPLDLLFPKFCLDCGKFGTYFCQKCVSRIYQKELVCPSCGRVSLFGVAHPLCKKQYGLDGLWSLGAYKDSLAKAIIKLKYRWVKTLAETLVDVNLEYWAKSSPQFLDQIKKDQGKNWTVCPVPLHPKREKWRGFNQSALLGRLLSKKIGLGYCEYLKRVRNTKPQVSLKAGERRKNIKGAFSLDPSVVLLPQAFGSEAQARRDDKLHLKNCMQLVNCLLVDDVWTTGATLKECCYVLKRAGAKKVWAITIAR